MNLLIRKREHGVKGKNILVTGGASRAADLTKAQKVLGWNPKVTYREGFKKTLDWYFANHKVANVKANLEKLLVER
jgi:nucleoside-diphosphate-sugar epimerase